MATEKEAKAEARRIDKLARSVLKEAARAANKQARERRLLAREIAVVWREALNLYDLCHILAFDLGAGFNSRYRPVAAERNELQFEALARIHARACSVSCEIRTLLGAGYASGAYARWRTLHELMVISRVLAGAGNDLTERYLLHEWIERAKAARFDKQHSPEGEVSEEAVRSVEARCDELVLKYGPRYREQYGWAWELVPGQSRPSLADLEKFVHLDHWRPYYTMSSWGIHASAQGALWNLAAGRMDETLLAGPSLLGLADPGHHSLLALASITETFVARDPLPHEAVQLVALSGLVEQAGEAFMKCHRSVEP